MECYKKILLQYKHIHNKVYNGSGSYNYIQVKTNPVWSYESVQFDIKPEVLIAASV
jgi:hypothetical protein